MTLHEAMRLEIAKHESDFMDGEPLDVGHGYSVAFHSSTCRYCAYLRENNFSPVIEIDAEELGKMYS